MGEVGWDSVRRFARNFLRDRRPDLTEAQRMELSAKEDAFDSVRLFINAETQAPKATFMPDPNNWFDLRRERPGSIIRIGVDMGVGSTPTFLWYVIGRDSKETTYLWEIWQRSAKRPPQKGGELRIPRNDIELIAIRPEQDSFLVERALYTFHRMPGNVGHVRRLDRMWGGVAKKSPRKAHSINALFPGRLAPVPQEADS